jgi:hypothetical protein
VRQVRECDPGRASFCAYQLVVVASNFKSSTALLDSEHRHLLKLGWTGAAPETGEQRAAESPGHKLRVTYATAFGDLKGIDLGWIKRSQRIALALSKTMFDGSSALSLTLEAGSS